MRLDINTSVFNMIYACFENALIDGLLNQFVISLDTGYESFVVFPPSTAKAH